MMWILVTAETLMCLDLALLFTLWTSTSRGSKPFEATTTAETGQNITCSTELPLE